MKSNVFGQAPTADADYKLLLEKVAGKIVILLADDPVFTVFAVSDSYLKAVRQARDVMTGRGFFEILPEGPDLSHAQTMENVRSSFCKVLATQESDTIPVAQQYDLPASSSTGEPFEERHWILISSPVLDAAGSLRFISHQIQDVTERIISERKERANETRQAFLLTLSDAIRPLRNPDAIKGAAARVLGERLQTNRAFYAEVDGDDCVVEERYEHDVDTIPPRRYAADTYGRRIVQTYRAGKKLVFRDARTDPDFAPEERAAHLAIKILRQSAFHS